MRRLLFAVLLASIAGCATYREDLNRGQRMYEESEYERALAIWRFLERDLNSLESGDQARYAYLRGMTDYRLGGGKGGSDAAFRAHARHWLAIAKAIEQTHPGVLTDQWKTLLEEALAELNAEVYGIAGVAESGAEASEDEGASAGDETAGDAAAGDPASNVGGASQKDSGAKDSGAAEPGATEGCKVDADCTGSQRCQAGACVAL